MELTMGEEKRISVIEALRYEKIVVKEAGKLLSRSERQIYRMLAKIKADLSAQAGGLNGLIHKNKVISAVKSGHQLFHTASGYV